MALSSSVLSANLLAQWLNVNASDIATGATNFANAYSAYAASAMDFSGDPLTMGNTALIISTLSTLTNNETYASAASKFEQAIQAYWSGATFATLIPAAGMASEVSSIVTAPPTTGIISAALLSVFSTPSNDKSSSATNIANALHSGISSIVVTIIGVTPPPASAPITIPGSIS